MTDAELAKQLERLSTNELRLRRKQTLEGEAAARAELADLELRVGRLRGQGMALINEIEAINNVLWKRFQQDVESL